MKNIWQELPKPIFCLAPMEDVTDTVFRQVLVNLGKPPLMFSEFTNLRSLYSPALDIKRLEYDPSEKPLILQVWGQDPELYYNGAQVAASLGFDGIDINMGCPQKKIIKKGACSALINDRLLAKEIIQATKEGAGGIIPVSVKTRIGFKSIITEDWAGFLLEQDLDALIIHGRTSAQLSLVPANWEEVKKVVDLRNKLAKQTLIIGNGDIGSLEEAREKVTQTGADGVMIGRGILYNPWLFNSESIQQKSTNEKLTALLKHIEIWEQTWSQKTDINKLKRFFKIYCQGFDEASTLRTNLMECHDITQVRNLINTWK